MYLRSIIIEKAFIKSKLTFFFFFLNFGKQNQLDEKFKKKKIKQRETKEFKKKKKYYKKRIETKNGNDAFLLISLTKKIL